MKINRLLQSHECDDVEQFRDVAIEGWKLGQSDFRDGKGLFFHAPQTYYEKAYCFGYMEMQIAKDREQFREVVKEGFELGESDCQSGKELFFDSPQTYYEKGYFWGYMLMKKNIAQSENETLEIRTGKGTI